jgi:hypothetical protein
MSFQIIMHQKGLAAGSARTYWGELIKTAQYQEHFAVERWESRGMVDGDEWGGEQRGGGWKLFEIIVAS